MNAATNINANFSVTNTNVGKPFQQLTNKIQQLLTRRPADHPANGEATVYFRIDALGRIVVQGIFGTSRMLVDHLEESLDGAELREGDLPTEQEFQVSLKLIDE